MRAAKQMWFLIGGINLKVNSAVGQPMRYFSATPTIDLSERCKFSTNCESRKADAQKTVKQLKISARKLNLPMKIPPPLVRGAVLINGKPMVL